MNERVTEILLVIRRWDPKVGLSEHTRAYPDLESLYDACLKVEAPDLIERITIRGWDESGQERTLTLAFQSVTIHSRR
jgi:hypothetical protein